jgi:hypothetical protein
MAIVYTGTAISLAVPVAGSGLATAYSHQRFRASGAHPADVSMVLLIFGVISTVAFAVVVGVGAVVSGNLEGFLAGLATSVLAAMAMGCLVVALHSPHGRARLRRPAVPVLQVLQLTRRLARWPQGDADTIVTRTIERLDAFSLSCPRSWRVRVRAGDCPFAVGACPAAARDGPPAAGNHPLRTDRQHGPHRDLDLQLLRQRHLRDHRRLHGQPRP